MVIVNSTPITCIITYPNSHWPYYYCIISCCTDHSITVLIQLLHGAIIYFVESWVAM